MRGRLAWAAALALAWAAGTESARADAIAPPPERCPEGSAPVEFCHGMPTCRALTCATDGDCGAGMVCRPMQLCTTESCCSGRCCFPESGCEEPPRVFTHVYGACGAGGACANFGAECTMLRVCVPGARTDAGSGGPDAGATDAGSGKDAGLIDAGRTDAGRTDAGRDAGTTGGSSDGGCCSIAGRPSPLGAGLFAALVVLALVHRARRTAR
ncbi:MAG TPA: MYXO-CTERM sorting domain-containing protein [Sandaracinaceae bacterium]